MNDSTPFDTIGDEPIEARIVSWVLGEASAFEAAELERLCEERPELLVFRRRMRALHGLLTEAEAAEPDDSWKLPEEKRKVLDEIFCEEKIVPLESEQESQIRRSGRRALVAIAACLILTLFLGAVFSSGSASVEKARKNKQYAEVSAQRRVDSMPPIRGMIVDRGDGRETAGGIDIVGGSKFKLSESSAGHKANQQQPQDGAKGGKDLDSPVNYGIPVAESAPAAPAVPLLPLRQPRPAASDSVLSPAMPEQKALAGDGSLAGANSYSGKASASSSPTAAPAAAEPSAENQPMAMDGKSDLATANGAAHGLRSADDNVTAGAGVEVTGQPLGISGLSNLSQSDADAPVNGPVTAVFGRVRSLENPKKPDAAESTGGSGSGGGVGGSFSLADLGEIELNGQSAPAKSSAAPGMSVDSKDQAFAFYEDTGTGSKTSAAELGGLEPLDVNGLKSESRVGMQLRAGSEVKSYSEPNTLSGLTEFESSENSVNRDDGTKAEVPAAAADSFERSGGNANASRSIELSYRQSNSANPTVNNETQVAKDLFDGVSPAESASRFSAYQDKQITFTAGSEHLRSQKETTVDEIPADPSQFPSAGITSGLRSGDQAIKRNNVDAILEDPNSAVAGESDALKKVPAGSVDVVRRGLYVAGGNVNLGKYDQAKIEYEKVLRDDPNNSAARRGLEKVEATKSDYYRAAYDHTRAELLMQVDKSWELTVPAEEGVNKAGLEDGKPLPAAAAAKPMPAKKSPLESMEEIAATEEPYSTFSLNINDASFQIAKAALEKGDRPDPAAIKVEQFYNAVDYGDPAPASNEPVAATIEQSAHPIIPGRNLVRVALKTAAAGRGASQPLRLTLLVDQSGSMVREDRRAAMADALKQLGGLLTKNDHITVVGFSRESHLLADNWTGDQAGKLGDLVNQTASEGGTNLEQAINLGEQMAARQKVAGEQNRIVLFTDGAANLGNANPERLAERVKSLRQQGIAFDIAGIGADGVNDRLLSELARNGNGRYYVFSDAKNESFARQLAGAFRPAAENVKVQVHFNPDRVGRYKLIGFEKDRLKTEDFRNDAVDAAELAAEEAGVAVYQVETLPEGTGEIGEVSVRFRDTSKGEMVERKWTMPFESTSQPFDRATPSMQLAGLSMLAAEKLKGGPLADAIDFKKLTGPQSLVKQFYAGSTRVSDMLHVIDLLK
jgi:Mg-chelatase subunit ChlD